MGMEDRYAYSRIGLLVGKNLNGQQTSTAVSFLKLTKEQNITNIFT